MRVVTIVEISALALSDTSNKAIITSGSENPLYRIELRRHRWASVTKPAIFIGIKLKQVFIRSVLSSINYRTLKPDSPDGPQSYSAANN
jgi:hypothetical protein